MNGEIISVGTELILGSTLNTNAYYLSRALTKIGINVLYHTTVSDDVGVLESSINVALDRADILIFTGGLGPTADDVTKETVSRMLNLNLKLNKEIENDIKDYFNKNNKNMSDNNKKQAYIPEGSKPIINKIGTAPGIYIEWKEKILILLPGPPKEMKLMFDNYVTPLIRQDFIIKTKTIRTIGIGESNLETLLTDIIEKQNNPSIATYAKEGMVDIKIVAKGNEIKKVDELLNRVIKKINNRISEYIYSYKNETIEEVVFNKLKERNMKISFCESCTGGLISSKVTQIPGASEVLDRGLVTYSNKSKIEELNVDKEVLNKFGPVSEQVALQMALGLINKTKTDIALSITGFAGPSSGTKQDPVGLVYIGIVSKDKYNVIKSIFHGDRLSIQNKAALTAFNELRKFL